MLQIRYIFYSALAFLALHAISLGSFFYAPARPVLYILLAGVAIVTTFVRPQYLLLPMLASFLLDSSGHLFEWHDISLRLALLGITMVAWLFHALRSREIFLKLKTSVTFLFTAIFLIVAFATYHGYTRGHSIHQVVGDAIPYLYLLLFYPLRDAALWIQMLAPAEKDRVLRWTFAFVLGSFLGAALLSLIVLFIFSSGLQEIHEPFYVWWRDWVAGKATSTGNGFFRIVMPLHLLQTALIPAIVYTLLFIERWKHRFSWILISFILLIPAFNFSRIYFLALIPATLILMMRLPWKKVVMALFLIGTIMLSEYVVANLFASRWSSFGFQFLFKQSRGVVVPSSEGSASARAAILPHLLKKIETHPFIGEGLGATVTYFDPIFQKTFTTPQLDWGYLELAVEFGVPVALFFVSLVFLLLWHFGAEPYAASVIVFILVSTLTSPAIFHVLGILLFTALLAMLDKRRQSGQTLYGNALS